ncbi:MAG: nucleoside 2-deoxyribosyltransferase domain-containing protein [Nanoarchaeota archaeon]|nr:nucleoside 2-deoxyribosyltransferase domain-containing protein [Nanoarchaeota archaeon]
MKYIECPQEYDGAGVSLFVAGGISNCGDWQKEFIEELKDAKLVILNPRRKIFQIDNSDIEEEQITWEYNNLGKASAVSFWFPPETLCPITLYELGKQSISKKPLFIGIHPEYKRKTDVEIQTRLIRPEVKIVYSLNDLANQVREWAKDSKNI